ncbi:MAG: chorismate mutase [Clostridia bacterium]|nr:chorismate mutase [Clostridia bacterium]
MDKLTKAREIIDEVDARMAELFVRRMEAAELIAAYKKEQGLPVEDKAREAEMTGRLAVHVPAALRPYYKGFLASVIGESKKYQTLLMQTTRTAFCGAEGAFAHIAARRIFPSCVTVPCPDFASAYRAVETGDCSCAVLPIENSFAGDVGAVMDLAYRGSLSIGGIWHLPLDQSLLALPGTRMEDIREVRSHPQALSQCMPFLKKKGWRLSEAASTASAARELAASGRTDTAVIAARETAELYGLCVLADRINESRTNTTRFAVFTRAPAVPRPQDKHFVLMFNTKNRPGALGDAISVISGHDFNLKCLKSHPTGEENWAYYFYTEGDGDLSTPAGQQMLTALSRVCDKVKLLGSFGEEITL